MKIKTCCFSGDNKLPSNRIKQIVKRLDLEIDCLISQGVTDFITVGTLGFDQLAASFIIIKKEMGQDIRLIFALPCKNQDAFWNVEQKGLYRNLIAEADEVIYVSEEYNDWCIKKCNRYIVDRSLFCICAQLNTFSGTNQTVRYARQKGLRVINVAE
ncbi:hypothetical protein A7K50_08695 [Dehalobacter sp. MCB1]|uniref:SLOG family protein n=1 Tax=unclassified Dehalobacter TaxID=2635733 RepID=UPI000E6BE2EB|nr:MULTISPECIES: SLOG family protein [unclassified Dehalobacter]RJE48818.1 hypothetical protein A7K50_08695 [Dehalobacter sp. MCB1]TCX53052.1 DUF1273 domain-containing protein [Dehalobacter sp. 12DCB1]